MRRVFGPRTVVEAVFLVAVPVIVLVLGQSPAVIIPSSAVAYPGFLVSGALLGANGREKGKPKRAAAAPASGVDAPEGVRALRAEGDPEPQPEPQPVSPPEPVMA